MKTSALLTLVASLLMVGCEAPEIDVVDSTTTQAEPVAEASEAAEPVVEVKDGYLPDGSVDMSGVENEPPPITATPREFQPKDAKKGKRSRQAGGYLGALGNARFTSEHKLNKAQYTHALNLFWGLEGRYPKSHEEFMEKVIKANKIQLPELEPGVEYLYDPEDHTLKVYRPEE